MAVFTKSIFLKQYFILLLQLSTSNSSFYNGSLVSMSTSKDPPLRTKASSSPVGISSITSEDPSVQITTCYPTSNIYMTPSEKVNTSHVRKETHKMLAFKNKRREQVEKTCLLSRQKNMKKRGKCLNMFCVVGFKFYQNQVGYILFIIHLFNISYF